MLGFRNMQEKLEKEVYFQLKLTFFQSVPCHNVLSRRSKSGWFVTSGQKSQSKMKITIYTTLCLTKWNCHGVQFFSMGFSDTSLCKICPNDHPGKVSSIVRVTLIGSELLFFDSIDVKLAQCKEMNYFYLTLQYPSCFS